MHMTRRDILGAGSRGLLAATMLGVGANGVLATAGPREAGGRANKAAMDKWMSAWRGRPSLAPAPLQLSRFKDPMYYLTSPAVWYPNPGQAGQFDPVTIPTGFVTDFASLPQIFWSILRPDGDYAHAAAVHDWLYWDQTRPRQVADQIFAAIMQDFDIDVGTLNTLYGAVRTFGGFAWRENRRLKRLGEKRVLKQFPQDATITWAQWKQDPTHFS